MARPLEFDRSTARDRALLLFWSKGYQAASLTDLLRAMEISRSSFYATFRDKRSLYVECMDVFARRTREILLRARSDNAPIDALRKFFDYTVTGQREPRASWGCMLVNTVLETAGVDDDLSGQASALLERMQADFVQCLLDAGLAPNRATEFASFLMTFNEGVRVSSRRKVPPNQQLSDIDTTFRLLASVAR